MLLRELDEKFADLTDVDLKDDVHFFMHNDSEFYRKVLFPAISALRSKIKGGGTADSSTFKSCIDQAMPVYCKKFNIKEPAEKFLSPEEINELAEQLYHEEKVRIEQGQYDGRTK
jgi:hypothetical protein